MSSALSPRVTKLIFWCLINVYLVIMAGAVVRATGSGMGCPDWPKCFGQYIPPTDASQLPANYQQIYADRGYADTTFNVYHTWTEYINRLMGATLGVLVFILVIALARKYKSHKSLFWLALLGIVLVGFQAWLGAKVVASNLAPIKITTHMVAAIIIFMVYLYLYIKAKEPVQVQGVEKNFKLVLWVCAALTVLQIMAGTQVREQVDSLMHSGYERNQVVENLSGIYKFHRTFSLIVVILHLYVYKLFNKQKQLSDSPVEQLVVSMLFVVFLELFAGYILAHRGFSAYIQPLHLLLSCILFGLQFYLILFVSRKSSHVNVS